MTRGRADDALFDDVPDHVHPTHDDPVVASLSEGIGGPMGTRSAGHRRLTPTAVILLITAAVFALGMLQKSTCYDTGWRDTDLRYAHMCYSDLPYLYTGRGMVEHAWPYTDDPETRARYEVMEYPVGISYWAWGTAWVTHWLTGSPDLEKRQATQPGALWDDADVRREIRMYVVVNAVGFALLALLAAWLLAGVNTRRPWDAAAFAASPLLALTGIVNWDMLAIALVAGALWAWARGRPVLAGVMIGVGTAAKLYPLFLLGGLLVICWRTRRWGAFAAATGAAALAWVLANLPAMLSGLEQWKVFWSFNSERGADLGSIWLVINQASNMEISASNINLLTWAFFGAWCLGVLVLGRLAPETPRLAQLGFLIVAGFLLINKVYSPQYVLWLLPLAALARPRWRDQIIWQAGEVVYFATVWWYLGGYLDPSRGDDVGLYWVAIVLRIAAELYLVVMVVRDVWRPERDVVRDRLGLDALGGPARTLAVPGLTRPPRAT